MSLFSLSEKKARVFHQAIFGLNGDHPSLVIRAQKELARLRSHKPGQTSLWDRWQDLLNLPFEKMANLVLADTPDGGLLRAESPFNDALNKAERTAIWQRIGLMQFMEHYFDAVADLGIEISEQAAITGIGSEELKMWQTQTPQEIRKESVEPLKWIIALQKSLVKIAPDRNVRRHWLRHESPTLSAIPLSLLMDGKTSYVLENIAGAAQLTLNPDDLPRMGAT
jgi:CHAT domain-containing protein